MKYKNKTSSNIHFSHVVSVQNFVKTPAFYGTCVQNISTITQQYPFYILLMLLFEYNFAETCL